MRRLSRFFEGRNGTDTLSIALCLFACVLLILARLSATVANGILSNLMWAVSLACLGWSYFRIFSRNVSQRRLEDAKFRNLISPFTRFVSLQKTKRRQKNVFCFFKCPNCNTVLRVPKGKGKLRITCKSCQHVFERQT